MHNENAIIDENVSNPVEIRRFSTRDTLSNIVLEFHRFLGFRRIRQSLQTDLHFRSEGQTVFSPLHRTLETEGNSWKMRQSIAIVSRLLKGFHRNDGVFWIFLRLKVILIMVKIFPRNIFHFHSKKLGSI